MRHLPPILVVDDDPNMRATLEGILQAERHDVVPAGSAEEALRLLEDREFLLMISDVRLGKMSGHELLKESRRRWPSVPVILITASSSMLP